MAMTDRANTDKAGTMLDHLRTIGYALLIAIVIRALFFQPFNIPSASMQSTLLIGDYLFVSKYSYGYSRHSLPFSPPIFSGRLFGSMPERGDVVVFKLPSDGRTDYIKRVVGLPGDTLQMIDGVLHINGEPVKRTRVEDFIEEDLFGNLRRIPRFREQLPNGRTYYTLDLIKNGLHDNTGVYRVPDGHFFAMGDNRDNSSDSRVPSAVGYVPMENIVGKAQIIFFSTDGSARLWEIWNWPSAIRWDRLFQSVN